MALRIRWLEHGVFRTNPALDSRTLRRALGPAEQNASSTRHTHLMRLLRDRYRRAGPLPKQWRLAYDDALNRAVARLVLDDVLRLRSGSRFVGGVTAYHDIVQSTPPESRPDTRFASRYSLDVLEAASALPVGSAAELVLVLYYGHRIPVTPAARQQFPSPHRTMRVLCDVGTPTRQLLDAKWRMAAPAPRKPIWLSWTKRRGRRRDERTLTYKLYISAAFHRLGDAFRAALPVLTAHEVRTFKIGCDAYQLVRPDHFVAYVESRIHLEHTAASLRGALGDIEPRGVPFCAPAGGDESGLLSWGVDFASVVTSADDRTSWRWWLCERLARFLAAAKEVTGEPSVAPVTFALDRLALDGIDVATFTPTDGFLVEAALPVASRRAR
jgi:hypothetical protein